MLELVCGAVMIRGHGPTNKYPSLALYGQETEALGSTLAAKAWGSQMCQEQIPLQCQLSTSTHLVTSTNLLKSLGTHAVDSLSNVRGLLLQVHQDLNNKPWQVASPDESSWQPLSAGSLMGWHNSDNFLLCEAGLAF